MLLFVCLLFLFVSRLLNDLHGTIFTHKYLHWFCFNFFLISTALRNNNCYYWFIFRQFGRMIEVGPVWMRCGLWKLKTFPKRLPAIPSRTPLRININRWPLKSFCSKGRSFLVFGSKKNISVKGSVIVMWFYLFIWIK